MDVYPSFSNALASSPITNLSITGANATAAAAALSNMTSATTAMASSPESLEMAGRRVEEMLHRDSEFPPLASKLRIGVPGGVPPMSGLQEADYPSGGPPIEPSAAGGGQMTAADQNLCLQQRSSMRKVPLPAELVEHFGHMQANCMIGLFPEIDRAWLTIDSDIYVWRFEDCQDLAYFDGLSDTILSVGLLTPKPDIFKASVKHLLCLTTASEIVLLGVVFNAESVDALGYPEMQVLPEPLFTLSTDSTHMLCVKGTGKGRVFMGGKDGSLYEFAYKADDGWFGKKATKINHSTSTFSFLVPAFVNAALSEEDPLVQLEVDDSRNILYTRSEKGSIQVFDLGLDGMQLNKVAAIAQQNLVKEASRIAQNIDKSNFSPIVGISSLSNSESLQVGLVAVTGSGVRLYFTVTSGNMSAAAGAATMDRPTTLSLQHVRLPPGFAPSSFATAGRPSKVHLSYYKNGTLLLSSAQNEASDQLWLISGDCFPQDNRLMEGQSTLAIDGRVWALEEIPYTGKLNRLYKESFGSMESPLLAVQHAQVSRRFVVISAQGTHIVSKLRPADHLRQLLIEHGGPDNNQVKTFFRLFGQVEASAICLVLATSQSVQDAQIAEWATRAFLLYGGLPSLMQQQQQQPPPPPQSLGGVLSPHHGEASFHPNVASTPAPPHAMQTYFMEQQQQQQQRSMFFGHNQPVSFSGKHNGLYLYFARLVRPVWLKALVVPTATAGGKEATLASSVTSEEIDWVNSKLLELKAFVERNSQFVASLPQDQKQAAAAATQQPPPPHQQQDAAFVRERQSLMFLQQLLNHTVQVLGLWKIVCDHQCHVVTTRQLSPDDQMIVRGMYFRDLIISLSGREMCGRLVQAVIGLYLGDNAKTDAISHRLRQACPSLYNMDDAVSSKAHEMIIGARMESNLTERQKTVAQAVQLCKKVAAKLNLDILVSHLVAVDAYIGVVEICLASAQKRDPQGLALHFYKNGEPPEDHQGMQAFIARAGSYKHITFMLKKLLESSSAPSQSASSSAAAAAGGSGGSKDQSGGGVATAAAATGLGSLAPADAVSQAEQVLNVALKSDDELFHVELYSWLLQEGLYDRLLSIKRNSYLEDFLTRGTSQQPNNLAMFDLLWKYYKKNNNYLAAARILAKLAERHSTEIDLKARIEYLSRAIVCIKSEETGVGILESHRGGGAASAAGAANGAELLHDLEEQMEVVRVQQSLVEAVSNLPRTPEVEQAILQLNADLMSITQLYSDYAEPYQLWECQLAILHCAGHPDSMLIETVWDQIINREISRTAEMRMQPHDRINVMANKIKTMGKIYSSSQKYFPLEHLVRTLELFSVSLKVSYDWVFQSLLEIGIPLPRVFEVYNRLYASNDPIWLTQGCPNHLLNALAKILDQFANSPNIVAFSERRSFTVHCLDVIGNCLNYLYTKHDSNDLVKEFKGIQAKLERLN